MRFGRWNKLHNRTDPISNPFVSSLVQLVEALALTHGVFPVLQPGRFRFVHCFLHENLPRHQLLMIMREPFVVALLRFSQAF